jgi:hypothetical protein
LEAPRRTWKHAGEMMIARDLLVTSRAYIGGRGGKWYAWHDVTAGAAPTLYVTGECALEIPGVRVVLKRAVRQGADGRILVLEKVAVPAPEAAADAGMHTSVRYDEPTVVLFAQVLIQPDDVLLDVVVAP